ncbi:PAS domain S-box protein [Halomicrobium mukohataei]|uniref:histidine kinase n=1 Tax=Halomicrobium mukohataei TaxID=57705 RepID=A0A847UF96_9EURY|nr:PAS domain S-box protein [Halomicrobium mukohataei]NLV10190.1 PAS domain S-box protein [Halomicrobium mukohataei]
MSALRVLHVRPAGWSGPELGDDFAVTVVHEIDGADFETASLDCAVVEAALGDENGIDALTALRERAPSLPIVLSTAVADGAVAAAATRHGVTEYVPRDGAVRVADRVRAVVADHTVDDVPAPEPAGESAAANAGISEREQRQHALTATNEALESLATLASRNDLTQTERIRRALEIGRQRLGLPFGYFTRIDGSTQRIQVTAGRSELVRAGMSVPLSETYCRRTTQQDGLLTIADAEREGWDDDLAFESFGVSCYLGGTVVVDGETYGTLCFAAMDPRDRSFTDAEKRLVNLLVEWVGNEIERHQRETDLQRYADIIEAVDDGVYTLDDEGRFTLVNDAMTDLTGYDRETLLGSHTGLIKDDATVDRAQSILVEMLRGVRADEETFELSIQRADGTAFPAQDHMTILRDDGAFAGTAGVIRDVTAQRTRDEALEGLLETTRSLMAAQTPTEVAEIVAGAASETLGFELNLVRLYDPVEDTLVPMATGGDGATEIDRPIRDSDEGYPGEAFTTGETLVVDDLNDRAGYDNGPAASAIYLPLGEYGVCTVASTEPRAFDDSDRSIAEILASNAAAAFERVDREQELLRYETAVENVNDMLYVLDDEGRFQLVTQPLATYLGFDRSELLGARPEIVLDDATVGRFEAEIGSLRRGDADHADVQTELSTADGNDRPVEIEISLISGEGAFQGTVGVVRDRTELQQTRERLHQEQTRFSYLFDALPDPVVEAELIDGEPVVRSANPAFAETFDLGDSSLSGRTLGSLLRGPDDSESTDPSLSAVVDGESAQGELRRWTADGFRDFLFRAVPYQRGDGRQFAFGIYTDITEQRERQRRLEVLNRVLRHNLRNDMTVILGTAEELVGRADDEEHRTLLKRLLRKAEGVVSLSDRAREIEAAVRRDPATTDSVSVPDIVESVVDELATEHPEATLRTDCDPVPPIADPRLRTALYETVQNALEHNETPTVSVDVTADAESVCIRIEDDGSGIPADELAVVTGDAEITQLTHGTGLGLWLITWLIESYGGTVTFENTAGTTVTLRVPHTDR